MFNQLFRKEKTAQERSKDNKDKSYFEEEKMELPPGFAQTVMDLEMQL